jgi:hypothetical protein
MYPQDYRTMVLFYADAFLAICQILTGTKYPSKHLTRWLRRIYRSLRSRNPEMSRTEAIYKAAFVWCTLAGLDYPEKKHQYSRLIDEIKEEPYLDFVEVAFRIAIIERGAVGVDDSHTEKLRRNIENELKSEAR